METRKRTEYRMRMEYQGENGNPERNVRNQEGKSKMKLSIIVPVYNMAADGKLEYCLDSLMAQTIGDYEVIAVNDASTDNSLEILNDYKKCYPHKMHVITYPDNRRQGGAKNAGLKAALGEWIGFVDSDDWVSHDCYEKLLAKAEATGADMVGCDYSLVHEHTMVPGEVIRNNSMDQTGVLDREKHGKLIMRSGSMVIKIYRHSIIKENHLDFPEKIFYEDNCAGPVWSLYFTRFEKVEEPLYYYYQHQASTVHKVTEEKCRDRMKAGELLYEEFEKRGFLQEYHTELEYRFTELYYVNTLFTYMLGMKKHKLSFVKELYQGILLRFPQFEVNPYYQQHTGAEEKYFIGLKKKSVALFFYYYLLKWKVRTIKKRLGK